MLPKTSHLGLLVSTVLNQASVSQGHRWLPMVVPPHPVPDGPLRFLKGLELMLPDTLIF